MSASQRLPVSVKLLAELGLDAALNPKPDSQVRLRKIDGSAEAQLIALACSQPPEGRKEWTLRLLAAQMVKLDDIESVSHETVRQVLKKRTKRLG